MTFQRRLIEAAVAAALLIPGAALAQPPSTQPSARVAYNDLDLGSDAGAQAMLTRIRRAAVEVCRAQVQADAGVDAAQKFDACRRKTVAQAVKQLGAPSVLAAYEARPIRLA